MSVRRRLRLPAAVADGTDAAGYLRRVEREFDVHIPAAEAERFTTLADLCAYVGRSRPATATADVIWPTVRRITACAFGVDPAELTPAVRYVEDLLC